MTIVHVDPDGLYRSPAFSQAVVAEGGRTIYIGGQNGILADGTLAGESLASQTEQAYRNILAILESVGASQEHVVKQMILVVKGQDIHEGYAATQRVWGTHPTAVSFAFVEGLALPGALVEIDAVAVIDA